MPARILYVNVWLLLTLPAAQLRAADTRLLSLLQARAEEISTFQADVECTRTLSREQLKKADMKRQHADYLATQGDHDAARQVREAADRLEAMVGRSPHTYFGRYYTDGQGHARWEPLGQLGEDLSKRTTRWIKVFAGEHWKTYGRYSRTDPVNHTAGEIIVHRNPDSVVDWWLEGGAPRRRAGGGI